MKDKIKGKFLKFLSFVLLLPLLLFYAASNSGCLAAGIKDQGFGSSKNEVTGKVKLRKNARHFGRKSEKNYTGGKIWNFGTVKFYLPLYPTDYIQNLIVTQHDYFEGSLLRKLDAYIPEGAVILDVGANIGNHTVYWAMQNKVERVYSFEPLKETYDMLCKNIKINDLKDKVQALNIGLSDEKTCAKIQHFDARNISGTSINESTDGDLEVDRLDNIKFEEERIDFVKIDVEGHEIKVLNGAKETFLKYKPKYVFIESFSNNFPETKRILESYGYKLTDFPVEASNYLFEYTQKV